MIARPLPRHAAAVVLLLLVAAGCRPPRAEPLRGAPVPARLPEAQLPPYPQQVVFDWTFRDQEQGFEARGEGVARIAPPDSVRLDLFLGALGGGSAYLLGDTIIAPAGNDLVSGYLPPPALLWAALGRLAVPPAADTVARLEGQTLRADIGRDPTWRVTFDGERLAGLERIQNGRVVEYVTRSAGGEVRYEHRGERRSLTLNVRRAERVPGFDASIWPIWRP